MSRVAALYVDPNGVYAGLPDVEVWDEARDALLKLARASRVEKVAA